MDRAKTLTQLPGGKYGGDMVHALRLVCKQEGLLPGFYRGLPVAMLREASKNMFRIGLFAPILRALHSEEDGPAPAWKRFVAGTMTGALGAVASNPFDLVKTRMQVPAAMSAYATAAQAAKAIVEKEGFSTFYKGVGASVTRDMLGSSVNLTVQSMASEWFVSNHILTPGSPVLGAVSGILSAAAAVAVMQPIDTSRAYVYLDPRAHKDVVHAARHIFLREGPTALYRGSRAHFFRTAPHYALMFALLEAITGAERGALRRRNRDALERVPIFAHLTSEQKDALASGVRVRRAKRGDVVVRQGDTGDEAFFVLGGEAASSRSVGDDDSSFDPLSLSLATSPETPRRRPGASARVDVSAPCQCGKASANAAGGEWHDPGARLREGDVFGQEALLVDEPRLASVVTTSRRATYLVVDRVAYDVAMRGAEELPGGADAAAAYRSRTKASQDVLMMWRRLRFQRELERVPLLSELSLYERSLLAKQCTRVTFEAGSKIMQQGDVAEKFFILLRGGAVALRRDAEDDAAEARFAPHRVLRSYGPGAHFGELALLTGGPRRETIIARERTVALVMDKNALAAMRSAVPTLEDHIVRGMRHYDHIEQFTSMAMA